MSLADFATCFTFSIALAARLFCCDGSGWSTEATVPATVAPVVGRQRLDAVRFGTVGWRLLCLGVLRARRHHRRRRQHTNAVTANVANDVIRQKGLQNSFNAKSSILLSRTDMRRVNHERRQRAARQSWTRLASGEPCEVLNRSKSPESFH